MQLDRQVTHRLRDHEFVHAGRASRVVQLLMMPPFEPYVAWDIFRRGRKGEATTYLLTRTCWRSDLDLPKFATPEIRAVHPTPLVPTVECDLVPFDDGKARQLAVDLRGLEVPLGAGRPDFMLEGTVYELLVVGRLTSARLAWRERPPTTWSALGKLADDMLRQFEQAHTQFEKTAAHGDREP
jgi:hypothetical protein